MARVSGDGIGSFLRSATSFSDSPAFHPVLSGCTGLTACLAPLSIFPLSRRLSPRLHPRPTEEAADPRYRTFIRHDSGYMPDLFGLCALFFGFSALLSCLPLHSARLRRLRPATPRSISLTRLNHTHQRDNRDSRRDSTGLSPDAEDSPGYGTVPHPYRRPMIRQYPL